ncbi:MAG: UDP-N-acetylmuramoyl-L-alanyl-D-glutamate--2,6-diaminopimelate ligase [Gammaproteobacteria bacterium HGW-Gammaproteobacteria-3]|nr:MAG: UDP-N-acetylmuramoyl-L-alanyl-D-glutamate--2,6-diaminopimelate ligase [Gammaproteobacteria bacterium HGW-Gammaproteobacteria-3]
MRLGDLLEGLAPVRQDVVLTGLTLDSRTVKPGDVFIALAGAREHGLRHAGTALAKGACAIVYDPQNAPVVQASLRDSVPAIAINQLGHKLGLLGSRFYRRSSDKINVIGITGTNGKTSCSQFLGQMLDACGIIGTLGWGSFGQLHETQNTTPDALTLQAMLAEFVREGKKTVAMEVSSHGLEQGRVAGIPFKGAVFTNISRDHLDYHGSMENYLAAKLTLLQTPGLLFAVVNLDDDYSTQILSAIPENVSVWGISATGRTVLGGETLQVAGISPISDGTCFEVIWRDVRRRVHVPLYGDFNALNAAMVLVVMLATGMELGPAVDKLVQLQAVPGRMECFGGADEPLIFVDYAHTPAALEQVLSGLRRHCTGKLTVVLGCGGNRDVGKRPQMGRIAEQWADHVIITDDNPRDEASADIIAAIRSGCRSDKITVIADRKMAITTALKQAGHRDCVLVAGKGHEHYQEIRGVRMPFSDRDIVRQTLKAAS